MVCVMYLQCLWCVFVFVVVLCVVFVSVCVDCSCFVVCGFMLLYCFELFCFACFVCSFLCVLYFVLLL